MEKYIKSNSLFDNSIQVFNENNDLIGEYKEENNLFYGTSIHGSKVSLLNLDSLLEWMSREYVKRQKKQKKQQKSQTILYELL